MQGLMNGAPYLCSALIGCWTNPFLNKIGGRRFTIFFSCAMSVITGIWMAVANSWVDPCFANAATRTSQWLTWVNRTNSFGNLLAARFMLGFAVGAKSSTTPVYSAESTPKSIRGALTMMWQVREAASFRGRGR